MSFVVCQSNEWSEDPNVFSIKPGDHVIVQAAQQVVQPVNESWWMGQVMFCEGGARDLRVNTMFQIANVDDGCICWVNTDEVTQVVNRSIGF